MRGDFFTFDPTHTIFLETNNKPRINETADAIWDRVLLIPWTVKVPVEAQDPDLPKYLVDREADGILRWVIDGCLQWQEEGLDPPDSIRAANQEYRGEEDHLADFFLEECDRSPEFRVPCSAFAGAYNAWAKKNGITNPMQRKTLYDHLRVAGLSKSPQRYNGRVMQCWVGVRLNVPPPPESPPGYQSWQP